VDLPSGDLKNCSPFAVAPRPIHGNRAGNPSGLQAMPNLSTALVDPRPPKPIKLVRANEKPTPNRDHKDYSPQRSPLLPRHHHDGHDTTCSLVV
jgi:hypothetical protein